MKNRQLFPLFTINFIVYFVGTGLLPVLPLYAGGFGVSPTGVGLYIAFIFAAIAAGTVLAGRWVARFSTRTLLIASGALGGPALALLGRSTAFWQVALLTAAVWFLAGVGTALTGVLAGLHAPAARRGQSFGLLYLALPAASLAAGLTIGKWVEAAGFGFAFDVLGALWLLWLPAAALAPNVPPAARVGGDKNRPAPGPSAPGSGFHLLVAGTLLSASTYYLARLGTTFSMSQLSFSPHAIAGTTAVGGLMAIPATLLLSRISDRFGRRPVVVAGSLLAGAAALGIGVAQDIGHFWTATALLYMARSITGAVTPALAADLLTKAQLPRGLAYLSAVNWLAGVTGSAMAGIGIDVLGRSSLFLMAAGLAAAGAWMVSRCRCRRRSEENAAALENMGTILADSAS